jgi:uncharacterized protein YndB with AHSA1/START domain
MKIKIQTSVAAPIGETWQAFNNPGDILQWDATDDWRTTHAANDLTVGGQLLLRIEGNDASQGFDFAATYTQIELNRLIEFRDSDDHMVRLDFVESDKGITIHQTFDADPAQPEDQQREEWQTVLDRFARYVERQFTAQ